MAHRSQNYHLGLVALILLLTISSIVLISRSITPLLTDSVPTLKSGKKGILYTAVNKNFLADIGTHEGSPKISFTSGPSKATFSFSDSPTVKSEKINDTTILFPKVATNTDIRYTTTRTGVKEEIVLHSYTTNIFDFDLTLSNAKPVRNVDRYSVQNFTDNSGRYQFHFEKSFAVDAKGIRTNNVELKLIDDPATPGKYIIKIIVDDKWLRDPARAYPVNVDPTIVHDTSLEFDSGTLNRQYDVGAGSTASIETFFQELNVDEKTIGLWHFNEASGNALDSSGNSYTGTPTSVGITESMTGFGNSRTFNGTSSRIATTLDAAAGQLFATPSESWTVESWFKTTGTNGMIVGRGGGTGSSATFGLYVNASGQLATVLRGVISIVGNNANDGNWHHSAVTWNGYTATGYLDGKPTPLTVGTAAVQTYNVYFGAQANGTSLFFNGSIDEGRISSVARTPEEILASVSRRPYSIYTSTLIDFTTPVTSWNPLQWTESGVATGHGETLANTSSLVAQWNFNESSGTTATNNAGSCGSSCNGTLTGFASTGSQDAAPLTGWTTNHRRWGAGAIMFDGAGDYITVPDNDSLSFGNGTTDSPFSISSWVFPTDVGSTTSTGNWIINKRNASTDDEYQLVIWQGQLSFALFSSNGNSISKVAYQKIIPGQWYFITATYDGSKTQAGMNIYINGVLQPSYASSTGTYTGMHNGTYPVTIGKPGWASSLYFQGVIDSTAIYSRELTASEAISNYNSSNVDFQTRVGATSDPNDGSWSAWSSGTGETTVESFDSADSSLISHWIMSESIGNTVFDTGSTNNGTATSTTIVEGIYGKARSFAGTPSYVTITDNPSLDITGDFTLMAWVRRTGGTNGYIITKYGPSGGGGYSLLHGNSGEIYCRTDNGTSTTDSYTSYSPYVSTTSGWVHVAAVRSGSSCRLYVNGIDRTNVANSHTTVTANAQPVKLGAASNDNSAPFVGYMQDARIYSSALTAAQIKQFVGGSTNSQQMKTSHDSVIKMEGTESLKITSGENQPDANTKGLWHLEETGGTSAYIKDSSSGASHGTPTGTTVVDGIIGKARRFNGTSDYIRVTAGAGSPLDLDANPVTMEAWIKIDSTTNNQMIIARGDYSTEGWGLRFNSTTGKLNLGSHGGSNFDSTTSLVAGRWYHVAGVINNTTSYLYINGRLDQTGTINAVASNLDFYIGADYDATTQVHFFSGTIDEVRISNSVRTSEEIAESYRLGRDHVFNSTINTTDLSTKNVVPFYIASDRPGTYLQAAIGESAFANYQPDPSTIGLWHLDEDNGSSSYLTDSSGYNRNGTPNGSDHAEGKIGKAQLFAAGDDISFGSQSIVDSIADFTIDTWLYPSAQTTATHFRVFTEQSVVYVGQYGSQVSFYMGNGSSWLISDVTGGTLPPTQWSHVAWVKSGTSYYVYINGIRTKSGTGAPSTLGTSANVNYISTYNGTDQPWIGGIDEMRISNIARSADEIRQAFEYGSRDHTITIDFAAKLDSGNLIGSTGDLSFTVDGTAYGMSSMGSNLYPGDKIIVRENYNGTVYSAQGTVTTVNSGNGAVTVATWDPSSSTPPSGFTTGASVFKWQREYWNLGQPLDSHLNTSSFLTLRLTNGAQGHNIWIDGLQSSGDYLTTPTGSTITSPTGNQYFQYRFIEHSSDDFVSPSISTVTIDYIDNLTPNIPVLNSPADSATNQNRNTTLVTTATDTDGDYLRYKIEICTDSLMTTSCQTFDQTASQAGWINQSAQSGSAYSSGSPATFVVQTPLASSTVYYWRSYSIDPDGSNTWSGTQGSPYSFTTNSTSGGNFQMNGLLIDGLKID